MTMVNKLYGEECERKETNTVRNRVSHRTGSRCEDGAEQRRGLALIFLAGLTAAQMHQKAQEELVNLSNPYFCPPVAANERVTYREHETRPDSSPHRTTAAINFNQNISPSSFP